MYQSASSYEQSSIPHQRRPYFVPNSPSNAAGYSASSSHHYHHSQNRFSEPPVFTYYPNLNQNPALYPPLPSGHNVEDYHSGGYVSTHKLQLRPKHIVKITNPETGDNIFHELEKERELKQTTGESRIDGSPKPAENSESITSPSMTLSSTNLTSAQQQSIPNSISEESALSKAASPDTTFLNNQDCNPSGSCESNSLPTQSSTSSRPPSVSLLSSSQECNESVYEKTSLQQDSAQYRMTFQTPHSNFVVVHQNNAPTTASSHQQSRVHFFDADRKNHGSSRGNDVREFGRGKSMYHSNQAPIVVPNYNFQPPLALPQSHATSGLRFNSFHNYSQSHHCYEPSSYYYEGEPFLPYYGTIARGRARQQSRNAERKAAGYYNSSTGRLMNQSSSSNSSDDLIPEYEDCCHLVSKAEVNAKQANPANDKIASKNIFSETNSSKDTNISESGDINENEETEMAKSEVLSFNKAGDDKMNESIETVPDANPENTSILKSKHSLVKEKTLDPNAKPFVFSGAMPTKTVRINDDVSRPAFIPSRSSVEVLGRSAGSSSHLGPDGNGRRREEFNGHYLNSKAGHELKKFYSRGSNIDYTSGDESIHPKKDSFSMISGSSDSDDLKKMSKICRSGSEGGNLENSNNILNGNHIVAERRNTDSDIDKSERIQYSREFLLNLQYEPDSLKTPKGLTVFPEIIQNGNAPQHQKAAELTAADIQRKLNGRHFFGGDCHHNLPPSHMQSMFPVNQGFPNAMMRKGSSMSLPSVAHPPTSIMPPRFPHPQHPTMMMMMGGNSPGQQQQQHAFIHQHHPVVSVGRQLKGKSVIQQSQQQLPPRKVIQVCLGQNVQLHQSENAWKPMALLGGKKEEVIVDADESAIMDLYRKVRSILNKLTPQKFDTLIQQVHDLSIDTEEKLKGCIKLIFEKAIGEPSFSLAYAQMAKSLNNLRVYVDDKPGETVTFRKLLLNQCQKEFEKDKLEELDLEKMTEQIEKSTSEKERQHLLEAKREAEKNAKRRSLGNIRFIGELFKLKMLTEHIMYECISRLLRYSDDEDNVECLCRLLVTIGRDLDNANPSSKQRLNQSFHELKQLASRQQISSRIKFMIQDVQELRENDWIPRREDTKPKLIEQIHKEAEIEGMHKKHLNNIQSSLPQQQQLHQHKVHHHHHHHQHQLPTSVSVPFELQRSSSLASSSLDRPRGSVDIVGKVPLQSDGRQQSGGNHNSHHQYQGRGSIDRNLRHGTDRFGSLERVRTSEDSLSGGNGHKMNIYATLGHTRRYSARPLTGNGSGGSSSEMGKTIEMLKSDDVQLAPISYKLHQHKPWQEGSSGGANKLVTDQGVSPLPTSVLRSRGSASDIYNRTFARSPLRIAPRSRLFDPKSLERDKNAAIAAAKRISSSASADSFINHHHTTTASPAAASFNKRDSSKEPQHLANNHCKPPHSSSRAISLSPRDLASRQKELEKKCQSLLDEYLSADDLQEACLAFKELRSTVKGESGQLLMLMTKLVNSLLEKSSKDRHKMSVLLSHLVLKNLTSVDVFLESLSLVLKDAKDISIDIPKVWDYLAELVSRAILSKVFSFTNLSTLCRSVNDQEKQAEFIAHVIKTTTSSFDDDLNIADQPSFITDLILFLSSLKSNGKGDNKSVNEDLLTTHSDLLKNCLNNSSELEWQVLMQLKKEIFGLVDTERAPATINSIVSTLNKTGILSSATMVRWNDSLPGCNK